MIVAESVLKSPPPPPPPLERFSAQTETIAGGSTNCSDIRQDDLAESSAPTPSTDNNIKKVAHLQDLNAPAVELSKYCKLCDISVTSEMHMRLHLAGAKHAKKLRQLGEPPFSEMPHTISQSILDESIKRPKISNVIEGGGPSVDYSVFRTPSGQFYCQVCDLSVTSEVTLSQHFASKRHLKTVKRK